MGEGPVGMEAKCVLLNCCGIVLGLFGCDGASSALLLFCFREGGWAVVPVAWVGDVGVFWFCAVLVVL